MESDFFHRPVLLHTAVDYLVTDPNGIYVDCNLGGGGHGEEILKRISANGLLVGLDADLQAIAFAEDKLSGFSNKIIRRIFSNQLDVVLLQEGLLPVHGVLFDLGISSFQVDSRERGFSFQEKGPLDMRFDASQTLTARQVVNEYSPAELGRIFREYGEERHWKPIARNIVRERSEAPVETTTRLAEIVANSVPAKHLNKTLARIFQAIRIEVNSELERLKESLEKAFQCLEKGGRLVVIAYHSLEDRIVKDFFRYKALDCVCPPDFPHCVCDKVQEMEILTRRVVRPAQEEIAANPRSRSARLRAAEKVIQYQGVA